MRALLRFALALAAWPLACVQTTNHPNDFGKTVEQPSEKKIARTPRQWCIDFCNRQKSCFQQGFDPKPGETAESVFNACKKAHQDCQVEKAEGDICCAELTSCGDFAQCRRDGAPAGC